MADKTASSAPSSAAATRSGAGFELRLERGGAYVRLTDQPIAPGIRLESLTLQVPDVKFPFDVSQGAAQFRHRLADLVELAIAVEPSAAEAALREAGLAAFGVEDLRLALREGFLEIAGRLSGGPPFTLKAGLLPAGEQGVTLVFHSPRVLGPAPLPSAALAHFGRAALDAMGEERFPKEPLGVVLRHVLAGRGWKLPRTAEVRLARADIAGGVARIVWDRAAAGPAVTTADPDLLAADEGARTFKEAEAHIARGDPDAAREVYLAAGPAATSHPFAAERLLSLLALEDRFHEEALDLAAEWLGRRPGFAPALATEAAVRLARGEEARAARALAALAQGAAARGEAFTVLAAAEQAFALPGAAREDALAAVEAALGVRRDHVPALRALRVIARAAGDREGLLRANRRLVAYDPDPGSKARAHAELGELLLAADPPGARLHLDQALRLSPDDADALAALAKACAAAGEPLRAVRALDHLKELHLSRGDRGAAARAALEAGALWEDALGHAENALLRYRDACELSPGADAHARAARAAEKAAHWAEAADHHAAVLSSLDLSLPGADVLAVRTRLALADVAEQRLRDPAAAAAHLEAAAALAPSDAAVVKRLLALQRTLGRGAAVAATLERLAALEPDTRARAALLAEAGDAALVLGHTAEARSRFVAAVAADPACRPALLGLAELARQRGDAVTERDTLLRLVPVARDSSEAARLQDRLADASERAGDLAGALAAARAASAAAPTPARLETALRLVRLAGSPQDLAGLLAERARLARAAGDVAAAAQALLDRARALARENPSLALAALAEARAASPGDVAVLRAQVDLAERVADHRLALGSLRALLASGPADAPALELRAARAALAAGEPAAAREHAERALARGAEGAGEVLAGLLDRAGDDASRAEVLARLGHPVEAARLFERHGDPARARAALERAAEDPTAAREALPRLAELRLDEGDRAGAARALVALARLTPGAEGARTALRAHALTREPAALDVALERDPACAPARARRAELRAGTDPRGALADAEAALAGAGLEPDERTALLALAARCADAAGDGAAARRHLAAHCEAVPGDDAAWARLAALHRAAGDREDLARVLARRLGLAGGAEGVALRLELSDLLASTDPERAALLALDALEREPSSAAALRALTAPPLAAHVPPAQRAALLRRLAEGAAAAPEEAARAHAGRARLLVEAGDARGALDALRDAARLGPEDDDALELRAAVAARAGDPAEASRALLARAARATERAEPAAAERLAEAGLAALAAGVEGGEEALRRALALGPERETTRAVHEALAERARERGDAAAEREALVALVPLLPTGARPAALLRHSALALAAGDLGAAFRSADEARLLAPRDPAAVEGCRVAALAAGDLARVAALLGDLAALEPPTAGPRLLDRARLLASMSEAEEADRAYAAALEATAPDRALADEHTRHRREKLAGRGAAEPLERFARRTQDGREAASALRAAAAVAYAAGDLGMALRCARRAYARTQDDLAFAAPLLARLLYLQGGGAEALVLHRRLLEAGFPGIAPEDRVALCRQAAELADDAGERDVAVQAYDRLLALRPQELDAALRRFELDPDRGRAARDLAQAAEACRSRRRRALALSRAGDAALREARDREAGERMFRRALEDAAPEPPLLARIARLRADAVRAAEGTSSPRFLDALHDAAAAVQAAGDRAAARAFIEEAVALERERALFADAARDLLQLDALAAAEGEFAESATRVRSAGALLREAGDLPAAAEALRRAYAASPESPEAARQLEEVARAMGPAGAGTLIELLSDRVARAAPGSGRADALVALADAQAGSPRDAEASLRAALLEAPGHAGAEDRLIALLAEPGRVGERARLLLDRAERARDEDDRAELRRTAAGLLGASADPADRTLAAETWDALAKLDPDDLEAARAAAGLLLGLSRREDAIPHLAAIVRADPDDEAAAHELAEAYAGRHRERGQLFLSRAERAQGEPRAARLREAGRAFFAAGDDTQARTALREAFEAWPAEGAAFAEALREAASDVERTDAVLRARAEAVPAEAAACHRARADALQAFGETERAIEAYEAALAAEPRDVEALAALATCLAAARGEAAATDHDRRVVSTWEAAPASVPGAAEAPSRYRLGMALVREGRLADAVPHLERAVVLAPADPRAPEAWRALARGHAARGEGASALAAARARVNRAAAMGPESELAQAVAEERELARELGVPAPPLPPAAARLAAAEAEPETEVHLAAGEAAFAEEEPLPQFETAPGAEPSFDATAAAPPSGGAPEDAAAVAAQLAAAAEGLAREGAPAAEIRAVLDRACEADPDSPEPWRVRARVEGTLGDPVAAGRAYLSASIRSEGEEAARSALEAARLFEGAERHADAARAYRAALHARPGCVPAPALLAAEALAAGDAAAAADHLAALSTAGLSPEAAARHARTLARALDAAGRADRAEQAWTAIFRAEPADAESFARAAALALGARGVDGWVELAAEHERALAAWGEPERRRDLRHERGRLFSEAGRLEAARGAFLSALELDPGHGPTLESLAALDARRDDWARAADGLWDEASRAADAAEAAAVYLRLARILSERLGDGAGAIAALRAALARARAAPSPAASRSAAEAEALLADLGAPPEAPAEVAPPAPVGAAPGDAVAAVLRAQAEAAEGASRAELCERLAAHLERTGDREGAAEALTAAIEADPPRDPTWSWLLALAPEDEQHIGRAEAARRRGETAVSFEADGEELTAHWQVATGEAPDAGQTHAEHETEVSLEAHGEEVTAQWHVPSEEAPEAREAHPEHETEVSLEAHGEEVTAPWHLPHEEAPGAGQVYPEHETEVSLEAHGEEVTAQWQVAPPPGEAPEAEVRLAEVLAAGEPELEPAAGAPGGETAEPVAPAGGARPAPAEGGAAPPAETEEAFTFGEPESQAAAGIAVESHLRPITSDLPADYARDGRLRMEGGDFEGAFERFSLALAREPSDLTIARDLSRVSERLGRWDDYVRFGEICADAIAAYDPLAASARFRHFADVLREKLGATERAGVMLEKALGLVPDDPDTRRELVALWTARPETAPRALDAWLGLARRDPADAAALAGAAQVCAALAAAPSAPGAARAAELGRIAASMAAFVAPATYVPPPAARRAATVSPELRERVAAPGATGPLARLLRLLAPWLEPLFPADLARRGAGPADRLEPPRAPALSAAIEAAARALAARPRVVLLTRREGVELALENTQPPAIVASADLAQLPEATLAFLAARALDLLEHGWALVGKFSPRDLGILLELACRFAGGTPPSLGLPAQRAGAFLAVLESQVPAEVRRKAGALGKPAAQELTAADPRAFSAALRRTANRVALLYAGDPGPALHGLALLDRRLEVGPLDPAQALTLPDLRDLALFALSEPFLDLRAAVLG